MQDRVQCTDLDARVLQIFSSAALHLHLTSIGGITYPKPKQHFSTSSQVDGPLYRSLRAATSAKMAIVSFTLSEEGVAMLQSVLTCINKFSDDVSLEARRDKVGATLMESAVLPLSC